jgi:hypothetical protein
MRPLRALPSDEFDADPELMSLADDDCVCDRWLSSMDSHCVLAEDMVGYLRLVCSGLVAVGVGVFEKPHVLVYSPN